MTEEQKKYYNAMKKLGSKKPQKPIPRPSVRHSTDLYYKSNVWTNWVIEQVLLYLLFWNNDGIL